MGLRLVGLVPCSLWAPKSPGASSLISKRPTSNIRSTVAPYIIPRSAPDAVTSSGCHQCQQVKLQQQQQIQPLSHHNVCTSHVNPLTLRTQSTSHQSSICSRQPPPKLELSTPSVATTTSLAPAAATSMLLVPFAVPGFIPVQTPAATTTNGIISAINPNPKVRNRFFTA